jgi:Fic-DOC domain mobile mystery protein B
MLCWLGGGASCGIDVELAAYELTDGATPIDADEAAGLLPKHIRTQGQLNQWEEENILEAETRAFQKKLTADSVLTEAFARKLHQAMFNKTWSWAGKFRRSDKNIGVEFTRISVGLNDLLENAKTQISYLPAQPEDRSEAMDNLAAKFHHQLVWLHPFANGNGRHARLMTDVLLHSQGVSPFSWGGASLVSATATRATYLDALRAADRRNLQPLLAFVRS